MDTEFELEGIESDSSGWGEYDVRVVCKIKGVGKLVVLGNQRDMGNVETIRNGTFPCLVSCFSDEPRDYWKDKGDTAWVKPGSFFRILQ